MKLYDIIAKEKQSQQSLSSVKNTASPPIRTHHDTVLISDFSFEQKKRRRKIRLFLTTLSIGVGIYILGFWFNYVSLTFIEREVPYSLSSSTFQLSHEESAEVNHPFTFQTITVASEIEREVIGDTLSEINAQSQGTVVFSNLWSRTPQTIRQGTELLSTEGKRYQTLATVTIPGYTGTATSRVAGMSTLVQVRARESGPGSNSPGTTFSIPSFSGTKRQQITAKSVGPLTGGESGIRHTLSASTRGPVIELLEQQLSERLKRETRAQVPEAFFVSSDLQFLYIRPTEFVLEGNSVKFNAKARGTAVTYIIKKETLMKLITQEVLKNEQTLDTYRTDLSRLSFSIVSPIPADETLIPDEITIQVQGEGILESSINTEEIIQTVRGRPISFLQEYVSSQRQIEAVRVQVFPFWARYIPTDIRLISVSVR